MIVTLAVFLSVGAAATAACAFRKRQAARRRVQRRIQIQQATALTIAQVQRRYSEAAWIAIQQSIAQAVNHNQRRY